MKVSEVMDERAARGTRRMGWSALGVMVCLFAGRKLGMDLYPLLIIGVVGLAGALTWGMSMIRCPSCSRNLSMFSRGKNMGAIRFCPYCAVSMDSDVQT